MLNFFHFQTLKQQINKNWCLWSWKGYLISNFKVKFFQFPDIILSIGRPAWCMVASYTYLLDSKIPITRTTLSKTKTSKQLQLLHELVIAKIQKWLKGSVTNCWMLILRPHFSSLDNVQDQFVSPAQKIFKT